MDPVGSFCRTFDILNRLKMNTLLFLSMPGGSEWFIILAVVLLLFGGKKIPELMRGLGKGIREFNNARSNIESEIKEGMRESERKAIEESKKEALRNE
jgi:sec-independent protein translocase protein TatA